MVPFRSSVARRLRRHWALVAVVALFLCVGALTLDDYLPATVDVRAQRAVGNAALDYLAGDGERAFAPLNDPPDRYYGAVFEAPLVLVERVLGLEDSRDVYRVRYLLTHLFFLGAGVFCYLLALRLFGGRALALLALALFLLHPHLYAYSFINTKDIPFLAAFMIALYLVHRAFRRETVGAFLLCGVGVGLLVNLRVMGLVLFTVVLILRALDVAFARGREERGRWLATTGAFALAAILTYHASLPGLWTDPPGQFAELVRALSSDQNPGQAENLFRGEWLHSLAGPPFDYVPVWVGITTPPAVLLLALAGAVALAWRGARRPLDALRNTPLRFGLLLIVLPVATVAAVVVVGSNVHGGWRHVYFLYAPVLLLAVFGLHRLLRGRWMRMGAYALAVAAIAVTVVAMVRIHPHEAAYFNALTDRTTPERLASRYAMSRQTRVYVNSIVGDYPSGPLFIALRNVQAVSAMLPPDDRERFVFTNDFRSGERNFLEVPFELGEPGPCPTSVPPARYVDRVYAVTLRCVVDPVAYFGGLRREALATAPLDRSHFDAHRVGNLLVYVRDDCSPDDLRTRFFLYVYPVDAADLRVGILPLARPEWQARGALTGYEFEQQYFGFGHRGARIDGDCVAVAPLPVYPIARVETGQYTPAWAEAARLAVADAAPVASSAFDVWLDGRVLTYVGTECADIRSRVFLHVHPADEGVLPAWRAEYGFENLDFDFHTRGAFTEDGRCVAVVPLPAYPIARVETGQYDGSDQRWAVEFAPPG